MSIVLWILLAIFVACLIVGCVEWFKGRGASLVLVAVPNVALIIGMLVGDSYPQVRYACTAVAMVFVTYSLIRTRQKIQWLSWPILSGAAIILLIVAIELLMTFIPAIPKTVILILLGAMVVSTVLFGVSMIWDFERTLRMYRAARAARATANAPRQ